MKLYALATPFVVVVLLTVLSARMWADRTKKVLLEPDKAAAPFATAISVLAIGIPLVAAFLQEVLKSAPLTWIPDLLVTAMFVAVLSLMVGAYVVYTIILDAPKDPATGKFVLGEGRWGLPAAMTCQYASLLAFLICTVVALAAYAAGARAPAAKLEQALGYVAVQRPLPPLGTEASEVVALWGKPASASAGGLVYAATEATVVFCLDERGRVRGLSYSQSGVKHGQAGAC